MVYKSPIASRNYLGYAIGAVCVGAGVYMGSVPDAHLKGYAQREWEEEDKRRPSAKSVGWEPHQKQPKPIPEPDGFFAAFFAVPGKEQK